MIQPNRLVKGDPRATMVCPRRVLSKIAVFNRYVATVMMILLSEGSVALTPSHLVRYDRPNRRTLVSAIIATSLSAAGTDGRYRRT